MVHRPQLTDSCDSLRVQNMSLCTMYSLQSSGYSLEQAQNLKYGDEQLQRTPLVPVLVVLNK
jgi:hypothetical protein